VTCSETNTFATKGDKWTENFSNYTIVRSSKYTNRSPVATRITSKITQVVPSRFNL